MDTIKLAQHMTRSCEGLLGQLTPSERAIYEQIPLEVEYVDHPSFARADAEDKFFGPDVPEILVPAWSSFPDDPETMAKTPRRLLNGQEEVTLFLRYNYTMYRLAQLVKAQRRRQSAVRARQMIMWYQRGQKACAAIVSSNMALAVSMAKRSWIPNCDFPELVSEGNMALLRCVSKFDVSRGFKFSTYACRAILKSFNRLAGKSGRYYQHFPTEFDPELEQGDHSGHRHQEQWSDSVDALLHILSKNTAKLSSVEKTVVMERFALGNRGKGKTLGEVGKKIGLTNERVRQIQILALDKIRNAMDEDGPLVA